MDDAFAGTGTIKELIKRLNLSDSEYFLIEDSQFSHHDSNWGWDARCFIYDKIVDLFDRQELERAKSNQNNTSTSSLRTNKQRLDYRSVTVPKFLEELSLQNNCLNGG